MGILAACIGAGPLGVVNIGVIAELNCRYSDRNIRCVGYSINCLFCLAFANNLALDRQEFRTGTTKQMTRKITLFLVCFFDVALILFLAAWTAWAENRLTVYEVSSPPSCTNNLGQTVQFRRVDRGSAKSASGMAKRDEFGVPVVYRFAYESSPYALQQFIDFHECAHHQTGDVDFPHPPRNSPEHLMNESVADCIATLRIRDELENGSDIIAQAVTDLVGTMREIVSLK